MIIRLVKMTFDPDAAAEFIAVFNAYKNRIRSFEGVDKLELYRDNVNENVFFTYSEWRDPSSLEAYRRSDLFREVWIKTRVLFIETAQAWSVEKLESL